MPRVKRTFTTQEQRLEAARERKKQYEKARINLGQALEEWECQRQVCGGSHIDFALHLLALHRAYCSDLHHGVKSAQGPQGDGEENQSQVRQPTTQYQETPEEHRRYIYGVLQPLIQETTAEKSLLQENKLTEPTQSSNTQTTAVIKGVLQQKTNYNSLECEGIQEQTASMGAQEVTDGMTLESESIQEQTTTTGPQGVTEGMTLESESVQEQMTTTGPQEVTDGMTLESESVQEQMTTTGPQEVTEGMTLESEDVQEQMTTTGPQGVTEGMTLESEDVQEQMTTTGPQEVTDGMTVKSLSVKEEEGTKLSRSQEQEEAIEYQSLPQVTAHEFSSPLPETNSVQSHVMQKQTSIPVPQNKVMFLPSGQQTSSRDAAMARRVIRDYEQNNVQLKYYWCMPCQWLLQENELKDHILSHVEGQLVHCNRCVEGFTSERPVLKHLLKHMEGNIRLLLTKGFTIRNLELAGNVRDKVEQNKKPPLWQNRVATKTAITMHKDDIDRGSFLFTQGLMSRLAPPTNVDLQGILKEAEQCVKCKLCGEAFKYRHNMRKHLPAHDEKTPYKCGMCDKYFTTQDTLTKHKTELCDTLEYTCGTCSKIFKKKERLKEHELTHSKGPYICEKCGKVYQSASGLVSHMYKHTGQWPHKCAICDKGYASIGLLTNHMVSHSNFRPYKCQTCGKSFLRQFDVNIHQQVHQTDRPFKCSICGKAFKTKHVVQTHEQSHSEQRNHQCTVCGQRFKQEKHMTNHMSIHSGERNHQCSDCGKLFRTKKDIQKHMLTHTQVRPHKCKVCGDSFRQSGHLVTHMMRHTGEWSHKCSLCGKGFGNPGHLSKHIETKHD